MIPTSLTAGALCAAALLQGFSNPGEKPLEAGRRALEAGKLDEAAHHLLEAWAYLGGTDEITRLLVRAGEGDEDALSLWAHAYAAAACDSRGKVKLTGDLRRLAGSDAHVVKVARARAGAVEELAKLARARLKKGSKDPSQLLVAVWAERLALELARESPAVLAEHGPQLDPGLREPQEAHEEPIRGLEAQLQAAMSNRRYGEALRLARALRGLARQAGLKDLQGPAPPGMDAVEGRAAQALARARAELRRGEDALWTVEELEALRRDEGEAFTRAHSSMGAPGVAVSPTGMYRVETDCGFETLLGVAKTIELHHERLARWYGRDPFEERPGLVRIVPEAFGLESEGTPFWWAGGFQSGDVTTMKFAVGSIEGLGHGLTHELTHRFDGALYPGQKAWLSEGKAVWTGGAFGGSIDEEFVPNHASFGAIERTWIKGYGREAKLEELITGEMEEYRDNYFAGYALYVYLTTWEEDGLPLFAGRMEEYMAGGFRGNRDPMAWFARHFIDGEGGRAETFEDFAAGFNEFIQGFYWQDRKDWTSRYTQSVPDTGGGPYVYDAPTWTWSRARAEPSFGQDQAREAGRLLWELGREQEALGALVWGLHEDGASPGAQRDLVALCAALGLKDATWALGSTLAYPEPGASSQGPLKLSRTRALLGALRQASEEYGAAGLHFAAAALGADHDRLAAHLGASPLRLTRPEGPQRRHPFDQPARALSLGGEWTEDGLTGYEELRHPGLWYAGPDEALHIGRAEPREGTGTLDRRAHQRHAFTRSQEWILPGRYRVSTMVQLTTSYVRAALVIGYTRRDRNYRVSFNAGDFLYSIGNKEGAEEIESIGWRVDGLFQRDSALGGSRPGGSVDFGRTVTAFQVDLLVDGAVLHVFIDGERRGTYHSADGAPIEGHVGFATSMGAIKVSRPTVQRLDRSAFSERGWGRAQEILVNHVFRGGPSTPTNGVLFLRMAQPDDEEQGEELDVDYWVGRAARAGSKLGLLMSRQDVVQPWVMAISEKLAGEPLERIRAKITEDLGASPQILTYPFVPPLDDQAEDWLAADEELDSNRLVLVGPSGVVRVRESFVGFETDLSAPMVHWLTALRDNGFPERVLPPVPVREESVEGEEL